MFSGGVLLLQEYEGCEEVLSSDEGEWRRW